MADGRMPSQQRGAGAAGARLAAGRPLPAEVGVAPEQLAYANLIAVGSLLATVLLVLGLILYVTGLLAPVVPPETLPRVWHLKVQDYVAATGVPTGWGWLAYVGAGDFFNYLAISVLAGLTIVGYLVLLPGYLRRRDWVYGALVALEICVLVLAASGVLKGGGH